MSDGRNIDAVYTKTAEIIGLFGEIYADRAIPAADLTDILREGFEERKFRLCPIFPIPFR